jgi:hypothetical protein
VTPNEIRVLATSVAEHNCRTDITDFLNLAELAPDQHCDHTEFRRLHDAWIVARDAQRLAQTRYSDQLDARGSAASMGRHPAGKLRTEASPA